MAQPDYLEIDFPIGHPYFPSGTTVKVVLTCKKCNRQGSRHIFVQCLGEEREFICVLCKCRKILKVRPRLLTHIPQP
jgi:hypothetical protein